MHHALSAAVEDVHPKRGNVDQRSARSARSMVTAPGRWLTTIRAIRSSRSRNPCPASGRAPGDLRYSCHVAVSRRRRHRGRTWRLGGPAACEPVPRQRLPGRGGAARAAGTPLRGTSLARQCPRGRPAGPAVVRRRGRCRLHRHTGRRRLALPANRLLTGVVHAGRAAGPRSQVPGTVLGMGSSLRRRIWP